MSKARNLSDFISDPSISTTEIADLAVTHAKLHGTMDLSSKTVTLPTLSALNTTGNVGIGTSSPNSYSNQTTLTINGITYGRLDLEQSGSLKASLFATTGSASLVTTTDILSFDTSGGEAMRINGSGNVGIGETLPFAKLHISDTQTGRTSAGSTGNLLVLEDDNNGMSILSSNSGQGHILFGDVDDTAAGAIAYDHSTDRLRFRVNSAWDKMVIDSSGNLLVGKTSAAYNTDGFETHPNGETYVSRSGTPMAINRNSSHGTALNFYKDGAGVGDIGSDNGRLYIQSSGGGNLAGIGFSRTAVAVEPRKNNAFSTAEVDIGSATYRFRDAYLSGGVYLGGTGSANKLEDYEEGTWTPTLAGLNNTPTFYNNLGKYTKVGRKVTIQFFQQTNSAPTFSNNNAVFRITGIPFTCDGSGYSGSQGSMNSQAFHFNGSSNNQFANGQVAASVGNDGGLALSFSVTHSGGTRGLVNNGAAGSGYIIEATVTYFTTQ